MGGSTPRVPRRGTILGLRNSPFARHAKRSLTPECSTQRHATHPVRLRQVLAPSLKEMNGLEILLQYGGLAANVCFEEVLRCMLATQVSWRNMVLSLTIPFVNLGSKEVLVRDTSIKRTADPRCATPPS